jgi:hypothetical protein
MVTDRFRKDQRIQEVLPSPKEPTLLFLLRGEGVKTFISGMSLLSSGIAPYNRPEADRADHQVVLLL